MRDPREEYYDLVSAKIRRDREARDATRPAPISPTPPAPITPPPDPALAEFERVRAAALARQAAEKKAAAEERVARQAAQAEEDAAVAMILDASQYL